MNFASFSLNANDTWKHGPNQRIGSSTNIRKITLFMQVLRISARAGNGNQGHQMVVSTLFHMHSIYLVWPHGNRQQFWSKQTHKIHTHRGSPLFNESNPVLNHHVHSGRFQKNVSSQKEPAFFLVKVTLHSTYQIRTVHNFTQTRNIEVWVPKKGKLINSVFWSSCMFTSIVKTIQEHVYYTDLKIPIIPFLPESWKWEMAVFER